MLSPARRKLLLATLLLQAALVSGTPTVAHAEEPCGPNGWCCNPNVGNCSQGQTYCCFWQDNKVQIETCGCTNGT